MLFFSWTDASWATSGFNNSQRISTTSLNILMSLGRGHAMNGPKGFKGTLSILNPWRRPAALTGPTFGTPGMFQMLDEWNAPPFFVLSKQIDGLQMLICNKAQCCACLCLKVIRGRRPGQPSVSSSMPFAHSRPTTSNTTHNVDLIWPTT